MPSEHAPRHRMQKSSTIHPSQRSLQLAKLLLPSAQKYKQANMQVSKCGSEQRLWWRSAHPSLQQSSRIMVSKSSMAHWRSATSTHRKLPVCTTR